MTYSTVEMHAAKCSSISHPLSREAGLDIKGSFQISSADSGPESGMRVEVEEQQPNSPGVCPVPLKVDWQISLGALNLSLIYIEVLTAICRFGFFFFLSYEHSRGFLII